MKKIFPRITTRGFYDHHSGRTMINDSYRLYPKKDFENLIGSNEITIMIHGLRNNPSGALAKYASLVGSAAQGAITKPADFVGGTGVGTVVNVQLYGDEGDAWA